ncbi:MAG: fimbrial biogenesis outer membrane usher protein [Sphingopyxis sp.]|nr:fimbrial biogenesis outer membrane usher protein [Sphingopyxis sp.]
MTVAPPWRKARRAGFIGAAVLCLPSSLHAMTTGPASYADLPPPPKNLDLAGARRVPQQLELELVVNGVASGRVVPVFTREGRFELRRVDLRDVGLQLPAAAGAGATTFLDDLEGVSADYDAPRQRLYLTVSPEFLPKQQLGGKKRKFTPASYDMGALLNYDVYVSSGAGKSVQASIYHEARFFSGAGIVSTSGALRTNAGKGYIRYDTYFRRSDEATATTIEAGDFITRTLPWASAIRLGGIQVSRDFSVRPDVVTYPLPQFKGSAALPSTVEMLLNGQSIAGGAVNPGPFELQTLPPINGYGEANLIVTDMQGRSVATSLPFYVSSALLRPGLTDFAVAFGAFRENYGTRNFDYGGVAASASARHGVTDAITLEVRAEIAADMQLAGGGGVVRLGKVGTLSAAYSRSFRNDGASGGELVLGYDYQTRGLSVGLRHSRRSADYVDLGLLDRRSRGWEHITAATLSLSLGRAGTLGLGYFDIRQQFGADARLANASWSMPLWQGSRLNATASREFEERSWSGALTVTLPLGGRAGTMAASLIDAPETGLGWRADYSRAVPVAGGFGWSASAAGGAGGDLYLRGDMTWRTDPVQFSAGAYGSDDVTGWFGASGSLIVIDNALFAANRVADAFVVVNTGGEPGIPVHYENQLVGTTNGNGQLLIPWASAYYPAKYTIDPLSLPADVHVPVVEQRAAVAAGSGHVVRFAVERRQAARAVLKDAGGAAVPAGTQVRIGDAQAIVGWDGLLYIDDLGATGGAQTGAIRVMLPDGTSCRAETAGLPASAANATAPVADLGELICR